MDHVKASPAVVVLEKWANSELLPPLVRQFLDPTTLGQLLRFGLSGITTTLLSTSCYLFLIYTRGCDPFVATSVGHVLGLSLAYILHSRWSFASPRRETGILTVCRFLATSGFCLFLNYAWVSLMVLFLLMPGWSAVPFMVSVTPTVSFLLNRLWVFRSRAHC
jgi:putative flippase GtrA